MTFPNSNDTNQADVSDTPAQEQTQETTQPQYITNEQLQQALGEVTKKMETWYHGVQTKEDRIAERIKAWDAAANANGIKLTDAQRKLMQDTALIQVLSEQSSATQPTGRAPGQEPAVGNMDPQFIDQVNQAAYTMQVAANTLIEENDAEYQIITSAENGTPKEYLAAVQKAIDAKQERLKGSSTVPPSNVPGAPKSPGIVKGVPQSNPLENVTDLSELWKLTSFSKG